MIKKCLGLLSSLLLIGILSGSVLYFSVTPTPAIASTKVAKSKAKGKVIVYYVYGKRGHTGKYLWSKKTLTGKIGTTYHTKALDLLNDSGYMALTFTLKTGGNLPENNQSLLSLLRCYRT